MGPLAQQSFGFAIYYSFVRKMKKFLFILASLFCVSCVQHSPDMREVAEKQLSATFFEHVRTPAFFVVQLHPQGATYLRNGETTPIRLHEYIIDNVYKEPLLSDDSSKNKYAIVVEKRGVTRSASDFSRAYDDIMEKLKIQEAAYMVEVSIEEITTNAKGEDVFGKRVALFSTTLQRPEQAIAADIVNAILEDVN